MKNHRFLALALALFASSAEADPDARIENAGTSKARAESGQLSGVCAARILEADLHFSAAVPLNDVWVALSGTALRLRAFLRGDSIPGAGGSYIVPNDQPLDTLVERYLHVTAASLQNRVEAIEKAVVATSDRYARNRLSKDLRDVRRAQADLRQQGVKVAGLAIAGTAWDIDQFSKRNSYVNAVDLNPPRVLRPET